MRYLSFSLRDEAFGVPLEQVREVIAFPNISPVPGTKKATLGMISLRNEVIMVIDLRIALGMVPTLTHDTSVIICEYEGKPYGVVVDTIHSVVAPETNEICKMHDTQLAQEAANFVKAVVNRANKICLVFEMTQVLKASGTDLSVLSAQHQNLKIVS